MAKIITFSRPETVICDYKNGLYSDWEEGDDVFDGDILECSHSEVIATGDIDPDDIEFIREAKGDLGMPFTKTRLNPQIHTKIAHFSRAEEISFIYEMSVPDNFQPGDDPFEEGDILTYYADIDGFIQADVVEGLKIEDVPQPEKKAAKKKTISQSR